MFSSLHVGLKEMEKGQWEESKMSSLYLVALRELSSLLPVNWVQSPITCGYNVKSNTNMAMALDLYWPCASSCHSVTYTCIL